MLTAALTGRRALAVGWLVIAVAARFGFADEAADRDARQRMQRLVGETPVRPLAVGDHSVRLWVMGGDRQWDLKPVAASLLLQAGGVVYVREATTGRWLLGSFSGGHSREVECFSSFRSLAELARASTYQPLPKAPAGWRLREVARLPSLPVRLASDGKGATLFVLCTNGDVWSAQVASGALHPVLRGSDYLRRGVGERQVLGMMLDPERRLHLVANERVEARPIRNEVTIFRAADPDGDSRFSSPTPWLKASYPWGIGAYNHGVNHLALGPDGMLYVSSGSRTDGNETGSDARYSREGETPLTACLWRLDPRAERPSIEVYARGLRNAFGFCWNDRGELFGTDNGPNADAPEELNQIRAGAHYGFPFQFADWTRKPYRHTPDPPPRLQFVRPIANHGPAAGGSERRPMYTFQPHSSPGGIVWLGEEFPPPYRNSFLVARFGNLIEDVPRAGFDVLHVTLERSGDGPYRARVRAFLDPVARPVDLHRSGAGRVYVLEYSRQTSNAGFGRDMPGRILELIAGGP